jgi:hypothetical protein
VKKYNDKLIASTKEMSKETLHKSRNTVNKLTHPSKKVCRIGSFIGGTVGICLILAGTTGVLLGRSTWGGSALIVGTTTVVSNVINIKKQKNNNF